MTVLDEINLARAKSDTIQIETARIEGSLRVINDLGGFAAANLAAQAALKRVCRLKMANDNDGWVA